MANWYEVRDAGVYIRWPEGERLLTDPKELATAYAVLGNEERAAYWHQRAEEQ